MSVWLLLGFFWIGIGGVAMGWIGRIKHSALAEKVGTNIALFAIASMLVLFIAGGL